MSALELIAGGLVVSCQAPTRSPLRDPSWTARIALAAEYGGAVGLRINGPADISAARAVSTLPIIGLHKVEGTRRNLITPREDLARGLADAGASIIAVDATRELLGDDLTLLDAVRDLGLPVMADISTLDEGLRAWERGVDVVGTTLSGYTPETLPAADGPDLELVAALADRGVRVIAEGRLRTPEHLRAAYAAGAFSVVVGGAITDPLTTTERFVAAIPGGSR